MMNEKYREILPYIIASVGFIVTVLVLLIIIDLVVFPALIHDRDTVLMPNVTGKSITDAENVIRDKGLTVGKINEIFSESIKEGVVINQIPKSGNEVKSGRTVMLSVSKGREMVPVPYLVGQHVRSARVTLRNSGLEIGDISYENNDIVGHDTVLMQLISSGRAVPFGSTVDLIVSKGSQNQIKVPSLVGTPFDDAQKVLAESGLILGNVSWQSHETYLPNTIVSQKPEPGSLIKAGEKVDLIISK